MIVLYSNIACCGVDRASDDKMISHSRKGSAADVQRLVVDVRPGRVLDLAIALAVLLALIKPVICDLLRDDVRISWFAVPHLTCYAMQTAPMLQPRFPWR